MKGNDELRRRAEDTIEEPSGTAERDAVIHELRVHQVELEMQNDELRRTQEIAEQARAEYAALYDDAPVGYFSLDTGAAITRSNNTFPSMLGFTRDRIMGRRLSDFLVPSSRDAFLRRFAAFRRESTGKAFDASFFSLAGEERVLHLTVREPRTQVLGENAAMRVAAVDITDKRRAEDRVKELLDRQELLFRELRHRTGNNYQLMVAMLGLQEDLSESEEAKRAIAQARSRVEAMALVHDSLKSSQHGDEAELGGYLTRLLDRIVSALDPIGTVEVVPRFAAGRTTADTASHLGIVVNELATNAFKHAFAGRAGGRLEVALSRTIDGWILSVEDDGRSEPKRRAGGSQGLGHTLVEALAGQLDGSFLCRTTSAGTRCELRLPAGAIAEGGRSTG